MLHLRNSLVIVPAKEDMRAEYCPSTLLVDGCPMELGPGAFEFFDENINRYVCHYYLNPQTLMSKIIVFIGISLPRLPSSTYSPSPISAVSRLVMSPLSISVTTFCGNLRKNPSFSQCSHPCTRVISFSHCS